MKSNLFSESILVEKNFFEGAKNLRSEFENNFSDPHSTHAKRFVWDYWNVHEQYSFFRTPAYHYFKKSNYEALHKAILKFGREHLGCFDITPPWLSYYINGCSQNLHADIPHGPWAFVYSLTPWSKRKFSGGETLILKNEVLNYWSHFDSFKGLESGGIFHQIQPHFNQLLVFDPRTPHGVSEVLGTKSPEEGRLVIHGWFKKPEPYVEGGLSRATATLELQNLIASVSDSLSELSNLRGALVLRFHIDRLGRVERIFFPTNNLSGPSETQASIHPHIQRIMKKTKLYRFPKSKRPTRVTLPLLFS
jgi:Rps23 Pro-64 3,4-dihydroxylase Tpa1-like proline 4-hydroxylase